MRTTELAVLVYGVLTYLLIAALALSNGAKIALLLVTAAAATTYIFQAVQLIDETLNRALLALWTLAIALAAAAMVLAVFGI